VSLSLLAFTSERGLMFSSMPFCLHTIAEGEGGRTLAVFPYSTSRKLSLLIFLLVLLPFAVAFNDVADERFHGLVIDVAFLLEVAVNLLLERT